MDRCPSRLSLAACASRHATDSDVEARAELHRDSWSCLGAVPVQRESLTAACGLNPVYEESLDVVVEDEAGRLLSYCIACTTR
jgi:hypothetical protein